MKFWKIITPGHIELTENNDSITPQGLAKVKLTFAGVSLSDLNLYKGLDEARLPLTPGHQAVGVISEIETPNSNGLEKGQRVVISPFLPCGKCLECAQNNPGCCTDMKMMGIDQDGLLADFVNVPVSNLNMLPKQIKDEEAIFTEHVAMATHIFHDLKAQKGDHIAIVGASIIGLILAQIALYYQCIPVLVDSSEYHLQAAQSTGIYYLVNAAKDNTVNKIMQITGGRGCERVAYLAAGNENIRNAVNVAGYDAIIAIAGWSHATDNLTIDLPEIIRKHLTLIGVNNGLDYTTGAINLLVNKAVNVLPLISRVIGFDEIPDLFKDASENPYHYNKVLVKI